MDETITDVGFSIGTIQRKKNQYLFQKVSGFVSFDTGFFSVEWSQWKSQRPE
jgi:hypothetical protein